MGGCKRGGMGGMEGDGGEGGMGGMGGHGGGGRGRGTWRGEGWDNGGMGGQRKGGEMGMGGLGGMDGGEGDGWGREEGDPPSATRGLWCHTRAPIGVTRGGPGGHTASRDPSCHTAAPNVPQQPLVTSHEGGAKSRCHPHAHPQPSPPSPPPPFALGGPLYCAAPHPLGNAVPPPHKQP